MSHTLERLSRRRVLRGMLGAGAVTVALPFLDCFLNANGTALASGVPLPVRFGTWFWGLGLTPLRWTPPKPGADYEILTELRPIEKLKRKVSLFSGFDVILDGAPNFPHISGNYGLRTGMAPQKPGQIPGASFDVAIAGAIGAGTRFRSLDLTCAGDKKHSYSFEAAGVVNPAEASPAAAYARIFGSEFQDPNNAAFAPDPRTMARQSVLSAIGEDRQALLRELGAADRQRLEEYFTSLRDLENKLAVQLQKPPPADSCRVPGKTDAGARDNEVGAVIETHTLMGRLLAMALACNQTRVFNVVFSASSSELRRLGDNSFHHQLTHEEPIDKELGFQPKSTWFVERSMEAWGAFLATLDAVKEGDGTLLDNCAVLAHSDSWLARTHTIMGIPMMLAGSAGGRLKSGLHIVGNGQTTSRLALTVQQAMGVAIDRWGAKSMETSKPIGEILA